MQVNDYIATVQSEFHAKFRGAQITAVHPSRHGDGEAILEVALTDGSHAVAHSTMVRTYTTEYHPAD